MAVAGVDSPPVTLGVIDHEWRLTEVSADATAVLGWQRDEYRGKSLQAAVHPGDVPALLLALGRSGVDRRSVATPLRMALGEGGWKAVGVSVTPLCDHVPARYAVAMWSLPDGEGQTFGEGEARLERHLWRIALEVQAAGIYATRTGDVWMEPALQELSTRQSEVLRRLLRGERVPVIARELSVSQSTVRNHLSTIYRRLGVHSQPELLARLME